MGKLYTCAEIAGKYRVQTRTVWDWIRSKQLVAIKVGKSYRIKEEDLRLFEDSRKTVV